MFKNKVQVFVDGVHTMALVDTGAAVSIMSAAFKARLGRKVTFLLEKAITFCGVGGNSLCPIGVCTAAVLLSDQVFVTEFTVLPRSTHDIILGIDFLRMCGATVDCRNGEVIISDAVPHGLIENSGTESGALRVYEDTVIPAFCAVRVPVASSHINDNKTSFDALVEPFHLSCIKKNTLVPHSIVSVSEGRSDLWTTNYSNEPVLLPGGLKLASFKEYSPTTVAVLSDVRRDEQVTACSDSSKVLPMVDKALTADKRRMLVDVLLKYLQVFDFSQSDHTPSIPPFRIRHRINTETAQPIRQKPYRVSPSERKIIDNQVREMLQKGIIQESSSPWAAPVILVKKKDGTWRFCVDYRRLNSITKKDVYPLPRIDDALDCLHSASYFSSIDLRSGYWQIPMHPADKEKTAFITPDGLYEFNVMPFGLCNAPATFERFMDTILRGLKWNVCMCYLDDIVIFGRTFREHNERVDIVLECIRNAGLVLNSKKCHFGERQTLVLGHLVNKDGIRPDPSKTAAVKACKPPRSTKELRSFLGLCSYFRRFIPAFADVAFPLTSLLRQGTSFEWTHDCETSFNQLKFLLTSQPILRHFDPSAPTEVHTDASGIGIGAVLVQRHSGKEHVIAYASRTLSKPERNYTVTEQECLALVFAVQRFRSYLYGRPFQVVTDHHSLCWLVSLRDPSGRLARWALRLQEYDFTVSYKSGRKHADADCLSRMPLTTTLCDADNFDHLIASVTPVFPDKTTFENEQRKDVSLEPLFAEARASTLAGRFCVREGLLYKRTFSATGSRFLLVVPHTLRSSILRAMHDDATSGHLGMTRTLLRTQERFYWPRMRQSVEQYVASCTQCQTHKSVTTAPAGLLQPVTPPSTPFEQVGIDLVGPFPRSAKGNRWIVVCADYLTRYCETAALPSATAGEVSSFLLHSIILRHGPPRVIISDRGRQFTADVVEELLRMCGSELRHSTPYHPQTNGLTERTNRTLVNMLSMYVASNHKNWDDVLPFITYAFNTAQHETTGHSPFFLLYVRPPRYTLDTIFSFYDNDDPSLAETLCLAEETRRLARLRTIASQDRSKLRYDSKHRHVTYEPGDLVMVWKPIRKRGLSTKLLAHYTGPFVVLERLSAVDYKIARLTASGRRSTKTEVTHVARLKAFRLRDDA